jgi:hypothetical protein
MGRSAQPDLIGELPTNLAAAEMRMRQQIVPRLPELAESTRTESMAAEVNALHADRSHSL